MTLVGSVQVVSPESCHVINLEPTANVKGLSAHPWRGRAACRRSRVGRRCRGGPPSHRPLPRSERTPRGPGTWNTAPSLPRSFHLGLLTFLSRAHLNSICFSCLVTMATSGGRPVLSACSSALEAMIWVVTCASAATPAPQQLENTQRVQDPCWPPWAPGPRAGVKVQLSSF